MPHTSAPAVADATLQAMFDEVRAAAPVYRPSAFWDHHNDHNLDQLRRLGLERFKRTVNQNYFNWLPADFHDNQLRNLVRAWAADPNMRPLRARMDEAPDVEVVGTPVPFTDPARRQLYALFVGLLWDHAARHDRHGLLEQLAEPEVGDPLRVTLDGRLISQDLANSVREYNAVRDHLPTGTPCIAELGAGYGRLAFVFARALPCRYWVFDIPPALHVAQWYLPRVLPGKRVFAFRRFGSFAEVRAELESAELAFFTPNQLEKIPAGYLDAFINVSSLHEMTPEQVRHYLDLIGTRTRSAVYLKQWIRSVNPFDGVTLEKDDYALGDGWSVALDRTDAVQDLFFEKVFVRGGLARRMRAWVRSRWGKAE
jgi:putative sugar O-methyltransferase